MMKPVRIGYDFDDLLLVPTLSRVDSRSDVSLGVEFKNLKLDIPIIASPMKGIISKELIVELAKLGGIGILHRFYNDFEEYKNDVQYLYDTTNNQFGLAVSLNNMIETQFAFSMGAKIICIDVANGYLNSVIKYIERVRNLKDKYGYDSLIMAGNVVTHEGVIKLIGAGAELIRVGIGSGQLCTTRNYTGVGYPQLTAISECTFQSNLYDYCLVADGGIRNSGDAVKALAIGADLVMLGSLFGQVYESSHNGIIYGMASRKLQEEYYHSVKSVEGLEKTVEKSRSLKEFIDEFTWGMKSALTYLDALNLRELRNHAEFIHVGNGSIKRI